MQTAIFGAQILPTLGHDRVEVEDARGERGEIEERGLEEKTRSRRSDLVDGMSEMRAKLQVSFELVRVRISVESALQRGPRELFHQPQVGTAKSNVKTRPCN